MCVFLLVLFLCKASVVDRFSAEFKSQLDSFRQKTHSTSFPPPPTYFNSRPKHFSQFKGFYLHIVNKKKALPYGVSVRKVPEKLLNYLNSCVNNETTSGIRAGVSQSVTECVRMR